MDERGEPWRTPPSAQFGDHPSNFSGAVSRERRKIKASKLNRRQRFWRAPTFARFIPARYFR